MSKSTIVVGLDGSEAGARALAFAQAQAKQIGDCSITVCFVIEWSPFTFQTKEENEQRHMRREQELQRAHDVVLDPAVAEAKASGVEVEGIVRHGDVADILEGVDKKRGAIQIVVGRVGERGLKRLFGGVTGRLGAGSSVPVTIIP